jgi:hypothetical protein
MNDMRFGGLQEGVSAEESNSKKNKNFKSLFKKVLKALGVVIILAVVILAIFLGRDILSGMFKVQTQAYSAVFLTNGQVYFGKMMENNDKEIVLSNVFYIQIKENAAPAEVSANALGQASFNLVKLGNELHGPTDELYVSRSQILFYEYLQDDSKVVESIKNYKQ